MIMTTVLAVALGFAPVKNDSIQTVSGNFADAVGRYSQTIDKNGTTHLSGFNRLNGAPYEIAVDKNGKVEGTVGDWYVSFRVIEAS